MNSDMITGKWDQLKGEVMNMWGKLTHDELDRTKGNIAAIAGLIEQHYGDTKEAISDKLHELFGKGEQEVDAKSDTAATWGADKTEQAKDALRDAKTPNDPVSH